MTTKKNLSAIDKELFEFGSAPASPPVNYLALYATNGAELAYKNSSGIIKPIRSEIILPYSVGGVLSAQVGKNKIPIWDDYDLYWYGLYANTAPVGADIVVDINKNGTTIFPGTKAAITSTNNLGQNYASEGSPHATFTVSDYISIDIDSVGSSTPGSDLTVALMLRAKV